MKNLVRKAINLNGSDYILDTFDVSFANRELYLTGEIDEETATLVNSALRCLARDSDEDITLYIQGPGGSVAAGFSIYDTAKAIRCDIRTVVCGRAASMSAFLAAAAGTKGKRYIQPCAEVLIHQPLGGVQGQASDIRIHAEHVLKIRSKMNRLLAEATGQKPEKIEEDTERDNIMDAETAIAYGLADRIGDPVSEW